MKYTVIQNGTTAREFNRWDDLVIWAENNRSFQVELPNGAMVRSIYIRPTVYATLEEAGKAGELWGKTV